MVADRDDPLLVVENVMQEPGIPEPLRRNLGVGSFVGVRLEHPDLVTSDRQPALLGTLFCSFSQLRTFSETERTTIHGLAGLAGVALANAHLRRKATDELQDSARAAEQVRQQADFHSALIGAMQDGLAVITPDGRIVEVNGRLCEMTGHSAEALISAPAWTALWHAEDLGAVMGHLAQVLTTGAGEIDLMVGRNDGGRFPAIVSVSPIADTDGKTTAYVATIKDVTQRRRAEQEIHHAAERNEAFAVEQAALRRVATAVAEDMAPERVFALVAKEACRVLSTDSGAVVRFDADEMGVVVGSWANDERLRRPEGTFLPLRGDSATAQVSRSGRPARVDDYSTLDADTRHSLGRMPFRCGLAAPIRAGGELWGALTVQSRRESGLPPLSEGRLADFAELVGMAISNAEVFARLQRAAETDPLTELPNRRRLERDLEEAVQSARDERRTLSVLVLDLDEFKRINDAHGHETGDAVLRSVARSLEAGLRPCDTAGRLGGEEFLIILPDTGARGAALVAERLRMALTHIPGIDAAPVTASFGVAAFPTHATSAGELLRAADSAMYQAKGLGRNRTVQFNASAARTGAEKAAQAQADLQGYVRSVLALAAALDERDTYTHEHSHTVAGYAAAIGAVMGLDGDRLEDLRIAGLLHDVGKVGVADSVLKKAGPLTDEEWEEMRRHPEIGARLLTHPGLSEVRSWVLCHHERPDGRGYPGGLMGDDIPREARILAVADAYEAMTSDRPYRSALPFKEACAELRRGRGTQFDSEVVDALLLHLTRTNAADATDAPPQSLAPRTVVSGGLPER
jgi:diguanylate cyclase (GGDEF)-like protein/PAS domain S-box-containing protein